MSCCRNTKTHGSLARAAQKLSNHIAETSAPRIAFLAARDDRRRRTICRPTAMKF
jgi:hypothetical protein